MSECDVGKASVSAVARKHNIAPNLLFRWRRELGTDRPAEVQKPTFVSVALPVASAKASAVDSRMPAVRNLIEIELACGRRLRVDGSIDATALRRVIEVLEGR